MMLNFEKPTYKVVEYIENSNFGKFELEPLERGFGTTIGNALRRVMLSSMPGSAIVAVKVEGAMHEFQALEGIVEDVTTIILNLKNVVVKNHSKELKVVRLHVNEEKVVTAGDIEIDSDIEIVNKNQVIATVAKGGKLDMEIVISNGRGYVTAAENTEITSNLKVGFIPIDALYTPIERVSYDVESARVGQNANYDKLILNVYTDGSMKPEAAVATASRILIEHFKNLEELYLVDKVGVFSAKEQDTKQKQLDEPIEVLDLSVRAFNCLKKADINTLRDLTDKSEAEMEKIRNLGKKSLKEVIDKIKDRGLEFRLED